jgi:hypothetical protein
MPLLSTGYSGLTSEISVSHGNSTVEDSVKMWVYTANSFAWDVSVTIFIRG